MKLIIYQSKNNDNVSVEVLYDELLKNGPKYGKDYFRELLERIRSIRTSERRIWQQITDIWMLYSVKLFYTKV